MRTKKGYWYFGVGSLLLVLLVIFVIIWLANRPVAVEITEGIGNLTSAAGNLIKMP